jgi:hypothetical protein
LLLVLSVPLFVRWLADRNLQVTTPSPAMIPVAGLVLLLVIAALAWPTSRPMVWLRARAAENQDVLAAVMLAAVVTVLGAMLYVVAALAEVRIWVVGSLVAFLAFQGLGAVGRWRWRAWDERERDAFRMRRAQPLPRVWPGVQMAMLGSMAAFAAVVVIAGLEGAIPWVVSAVGAVIVVSVLRDAALLATPVAPSSPPPESAEAPGAERALGSAGE